MRKKLLILFLAFAFIGAVFVSGPNQQAQYEPGIPMDVVTAAYEPGIPMSITT
ncbi:hypothetical protein [Tumebacillus avium]|uniref:hypothetical protein n=1 Tax=Tumebacillus avium TaxID=1903704 RepID=UPI0012FE40E6|nr:hypothetical protein [Tumebacillus avium]